MDNPNKDKFKDIDADGVQALLTELPRWLVGDGKSPNIFFVTNQITGKVIAVFMGDDKEEAAIAFADGRSEPLMVEDRQTGVVHDNPAGERYQEQCRREEEEEEGLHDELLAQDHMRSLRNEAGA